MAVRIYMDACCLNRPFDDQSQERVRLESEAVMIILGRVEEGSLQLVTSTFLAEEVGRGPVPDRRAFCRGVLEQSFVHVAPTESITRAAKSLEQTRRVDPIDALHLQSAITGGANVFLTVDDGILRRIGSNLLGGSMSVENPLVWISQEL